ncbi:MAG: hypothetical protein KIT11_02595 [Fimbriimonadaceae bacterium]|nr:hypothetical protein [Fimbriimonadaceae bacterium]QYK54744.1 MAG: hypothetical protein KF733_06940 [Fimbriimonadaceae bacterium]
MRVDPGKAAASTVVLLTGQDAVLRHRFLGELLTASQADELDTESIVADARPPGDWVGSASTAPFLSERRVTVVRNVARIEPKKMWGQDKFTKTHPFAKQLASLPSSTLLILVADDETGDPNRQARLSANVAQWTTLVKAAEGAVVKLEMDAEGVPEAAREEAKRLGKKLGAAAARRLSEMVGGHAGRAIAEVEKLSLYIGDASEIDDRIVAELVIAEPSYNVFKMAEAITSGNSVAAIRSLREFMRSAGKLEDQVYSQLFPNLGRQIRLVWQGRFLVEERVAPQRPSEHVLAWLPEKNVTSLKPWQQSSLLDPARRLGYDRLLECLAELVDCEARMKGRRPSFSGQDSLEQAVLRMCAICRGETFEPKLSYL